MNVKTNLKQNPRRDNRHHEEMWRDQLFLSVRVKRVPESSLLTCTKPRARLSYARSSRAFDPMSLMFPSDATWLSSRARARSEARLPPPTISIRSFIGAHLRALSFSPKRSTSRVLLQLLKTACLLLSFRNLIRPKKQNFECVLVSGQLFSKEVL